MLEVVGERGVGITCSHLPPVAKVQTASQGLHCPSRCLSICKAHRLEARWLVFSTLYYKVPDLNLTADRLALHCTEL